MIKLILLLAFISLGAFCENIGDNIAKVIKLSSSKKTIILNRGAARGFKEYEVAYLLGSSLLKSKKRLFYPVAKIKLVKERVKSSIWIVEKSFKSEILESQKYLFFTLSDYLQGRTPIRIAKKTIKTNKEDQKINIQDSLSREDYKLSQKKNYYYKEKIEKEKNNGNYDLKLVDIERLKKYKGNVKSVAIVKGPRAQEFLRRKDLNTFDKMIHTTIANANKEKNNVFDYNPIFINSKAKEENEEVRQDENLEKMAKAYSEKGKSWSDDLSDEDLSRVLFRAGELKEVKRRQSLSATQFDKQYYISFGSSLTSNTTSDAQASEAANYNISLAAEIFILKKFKALSSFTMEFDFQYGENAITVSNQNAVNTGYSFAGFINWYPFLNPSRLSENIPFVSMGTRVGFSDVTIAQRGDSASYQALIIPSLRIGLKYNFSNSFGARVHGQLESVKLGKVSGDSAYSSSANYTDGRILISMSKFY